ncbi:aquaporin-11 isoform X2 [Papilio machaon]|uniref:aquaporin-11 isoform X2 n=1 Tax=Papilio machaon TaxID=76193 RepID=UPI001E6655C9|nr:aquaporin-11 isoform X2 [Papilio machaon]
MKFSVDVLGVFLKVVIKINRETFAPLVVSALFIVLTSLLAHAARSAARRLVKDAFLRLLLEEAIAAAELCGCCFELIIVADNFGVATYAVFLFVLTCWWALSWGEATACPYTHLEDVIEGKCDIRAALLKTWAELGGGLLVFKYVQMYWALEISDTHKDRAYQECTADLQVPALYGAVVEGAATCLCRLTSRALADLSPRFATAIDAFIGTSLVVAAFDYSGGYFNPVLATSLKAGCAGHSLAEHAAVYWAGAGAGAVLALYLYRVPVLQRLLRCSGTVTANGDSFWPDKED